MFQKVLLILMIFCQNINNIESAKRPFDLILHSVEVKNVTDLFQDWDCCLRKLAKNRYAISVMITLSRQLAKNAEIEILIHISQPNTSKIIKFLEVKLNICDALVNLKAAVLIKELFKELMGVSNLPYNCPIKGNVMYNVTDFIVVDKFFPTYTPSLHFNYTLKFYNDRKLIGIYILKGSTVIRN
ncbi:uncharacterized protein LOC106086499 [Stomoxys calcitrans]|uniref:uncharacterized protein LOC106086499 n=1 Tax=Stomoxys calcitrans TaxID=35570 RepID=UPI0027E26008|nr:uncharacterized protein LOC106086499 [Stomoxys calcitrans]